MKIIPKEEVFITKEESRAWDVVSYLIKDIVDNSRDDGLRIAAERATTALEALDDFIVGCC